MEELELDDGTILVLPKGTSDAAIRNMADIARANGFAGKRFTQQDYESVAGGETQEQQTTPAQQQDMDTSNLSPEAQAVLNRRLEQEAAAEQAATQPQTRQRGPIGRTLQRAGEFVTENVMAPMVRGGTTDTITGMGSIFGLPGYIAAQSIRYGSEPVAALMRLTLGEEDSKGRRYVGMDDYVQGLLTQAGVPETETNFQNTLEFVTELTTGAAAARKAMEVALEKVPLGVQNLFTRVLETGTVDDVGTQMSEAAGAGILQQRSARVSEERDRGPWATAFTNAGAGIFGGALGNITGNIRRIARGQGATTPGTSRGGAEPPAGQVPYGMSEQARRPGTPASSGRDVYEGIVQGMPGGTRRLMYDRYNANQAELSRVLGKFGVEYDELGKPTDFSRFLMDDYLSTRGQKLSENVEAKQDVIRYVSREGDEVPVTRAEEYLDEQFREVMQRDTPVAAKLAQTIEEWRSAIVNKDLETLEETRADLFDQLQTADNESIRRRGTQILNEAYDLLNEDMGDFIQNRAKELPGEEGFGGDLYEQWRTANSNLRSLAGDFEDRALSRIMDNWNKASEHMTPEDLTNALFSKDKSTVEKIYDGLSEEGKMTARQALIGQFAATTDTADMSPSLFAQNVRKFGNQVGIFFDEEDVKYLEGITRHFRLTQPSEEIVRSRSNIRGLPTSAAPGGGTLLSMGVRQHPGVGAVASLASLGGLGAASRIYETTPHIRRMLVDMADLEPGSEAAMRLSRIIANAAANELRQRDGEGMDRSEEPTREALTETQLRME